MSHYSDIGFEMNNREDEKTLIKDFMSQKYAESMVWDIKDTSPQQSLMMQKIGKLRLFAKVDDKNLLSFSFSHDNERVSDARVVSLDDDNLDGFKIVCVEKDDVPFWFHSPNADIFFFDDKGDDKLKIASFANSVQIKSIEDIGKAGVRDFAAESYVSNFFNNDYTTGWVSGIIQGWTKEKNPITGKKYFAVDADCMGLHFKMLVDEHMIDKRELKVGKVICGEFWNTAILVAYNHPDYF